MTRHQGRTALVAGTVPADDPRMDTGTNVPERHPRLKGLLYVAYGTGVWVGSVLLGLVVLALTGGPEADGWKGAVAELVTGLLAEVAGVVGGLMVLAGLIGIVTGPRAARKAEEAERDAFIAGLTKGGRPPHSLGQP